MTVSCIELYNEAVTDLLSADKAKQLHVRKDERDAFRVDGLTQLGCATAGTPGFCFFMCVRQRSLTQLGRTTARMYAGRDGGVLLCEWGDRYQSRGGISAGKVTQKGKQPVYKAGTGTYAALWMWEARGDGRRIREGAIFSVAQGEDAGTSCLLGNSVTHYLRCC